MPKLEIRYIRPEELKERDRNPRTHSKKQIDQIVRSIEQFGFTNPLLVDSEKRLIAGHGRLAAARLLKIETVPTVCLADMSPDHVRAYVIADNKIAENAGWDRELLAIEFKYLAELDIDFDLSVTGFDTPEIDIIFGEHDQLSASQANAEAPEEVLTPSDGPAVSAVGDVWLMGNHRLLCGDSTVRESYVQLMSGAKADMIFSDPPYNVPIEGHVSGAGAIKHREFAMASGEMSSSQFVDFLKSVFTHMAKNSKDGSIHFLCMDWRHIAEMMEATKDAYTELKNLCVWAKTNGGMGSLYRSQHELVFVFKSGQGKHTNNVELGRHGRNRTNVWSYPGVNTWGPSRGDLSLHPTVKPIALVADAILDCSSRKDIILDPFAGSGTTFLAAQKTGRNGYGIEIDPAYCDLIVERMRQAFGIEATLEATGEGFESIRRSRSANRASARTAEPNAEAA